MTPESRQVIQEWIATCDLAINALFAFKGYLRAWDHHPSVGRLSEDFFSTVMTDLRQAGLESWVTSEAMQNLRKVITGGAK